MLESEFFPNKISYGTVKISHPITEGFDHFYKEADSKMYQMKSNNKEVANNPKQKKSFLKKMHRLFAFNRKQVECLRSTHLFTNLY